MTRTRIMRWVTLALPSLLLGASLAACGGRVRSPHAEQTVDSTLPREVALARFREGLAEVAAFTGGASSRDSLVALVLRALERRDTAALGAVLVSRSEYAWLYYPTAAQGLPPYDLSPGLYWFMLAGRNQQGLAWLLTERAGAPLHATGYDCGSGSTQEGRNTLVGPCVVRRLAAPGDTVTERFFSQLIERDGRWKVLAYYGDQD